MGFFFRIELTRGDVLMKIICLGGGPAGLYFAISMKLRDPDADITVLERNKFDDTFGWGVVLSQETLDNLHDNDPISAKNIHDNFAYWDDIATLYRDSRIVTGGQAFSGIGRKKLLIILQERAAQLSVKLKFESHFDSPDEYRKQYDVVIGCDGLNSVTRNAYSDHFKPNIINRTCKFMWLGTTQKFNDAFTFIFKQTDKGWLWVHAYQFDKDMATFIVECDQTTFDNYNFGDITQQETCRLCEEIFADELGGHELVSNANHIRGSSWLNFPRILCEQWTYENVALMGDAVATAHFSIGSGTKLALESAIALAKYIQQEDDLQTAFGRYQDERRLTVLRLQSAAHNSTSWFEQIHRYLDFDPVQFNYALLTRSQRIGHDNLRMRDAKILQQAEEFFATQAGYADRKDPPLLIPLKVKDLEISNRLVVAPMLQFKADADGNINDWHSNHYSKFLQSGAGLITTELLAVNAGGRMTDKCAGLYNDAHVAQWQGINDTIHQSSIAIMCQIGHAGARGASNADMLATQNINQPLSDEAGWDIISASALAFNADAKTPKAMDNQMMQNIIADFKQTARFAEQAGFDMLEIFACHGGLLASFISPLINQRKCEYGGDINARMRFPLEVIAAVQEVWQKPLSVRISANDYVADAGITDDEVIAIGNMLQQAKVDFCNVSSGETMGNSALPRGRMFNVPLCDAVRNEAGIKTIVAGNINADQANSVLLAGRADLIAMARHYST